MRFKTAEERQAALERAVDMYVQDSPLWQIEAETGVAAATMFKELHRLNIPLRNKMTYQSRRDALLQRARNRLAQLSPDIDAAAQLYTEGYPKDIVQEVTTST